MKPKIIGDESIFEQFPITNDEETCEHTFIQTLDKYKQVYV